VSQQTTNRSFDELARALASGSISRGRALRLMGGLLLGSALGSVPAVAWADDDRCSEGQTRCGERCVNLKTNERHCGSCRNRCRSNQRCCNGNCVNLQRNERHCGRCFNRCEEGEECVSGDCQPSCIPGGEPCTEATAHQCCSGSCFNDICTCPAGRVLLSNGTCAQPCPLGNCDGGCLCFVGISGEELYCSTSGGSTAPCTDHSQCPRGEFCHAANNCREAC
jgi:hypothetical protein